MKFSQWLSNDAHAAYRRSNLRRTTENGAEKAWDEKNQKNINVISCSAIFHQDGLDRGLIEKKLLVASAPADFSDNIRLIRYEMLF